MTKRPTKLVVYLDQNFISEMSKPADRKVRPDFRDLYDVLHGGFTDEKFVVPRSGFHDIESSLAADLRDPIRRRQSTLGHVEMRPNYRIKERQIKHAVHRFLGRGEVQGLIHWEDAFDEPPDRRLSHLDIGVDFGPSPGVKEQREALRSKLEEARLQIVGAGRTFKEQFDVEMRQSRVDMMARWMARECIASAKITEDEYLQFVASDAFARVPIVELEVSLIARVMSEPTRTIKRGDMTDLDAMAAYLPYCHVYGTDRGAAAIARSLKIDAKYECQLFDSGMASVRSLIDYLTQERSRMEPENVPHISIFVVPTADVKANAWKLFQTLGSKAKLAERDFGWWVEIFGFDDGAMRSDGLPYYGLQEVWSNQFLAGTSGDTLLEICRGLCRSTHFIVVDSFNDLDKELVAGAAWAKERGEHRYLRWPIHAR